MSQKIQILWLEDDERDIELISLRLRRDGLDPQITHVLDEEDFTEELHRGDWDVILADYNLPSFDGITALGIAARIRPDVPFIFVSGSLGEDVAVATLKSGATDYVLKENADKLASSIIRAQTEVRERTARRRAENDLKKSEERNRALVDAARDCILSLNTEGVITSLNPAFESITRWSRDEWMSRNLKELVHPEDEALLTNGLSRVITSREGVTFEARVRCRDLSWKGIEFNLNLIPTEGRQTRVLGMLRDVSDRRQLEEQLRQAQKMESIGRFAGGIAHDFNNLLTVIRGNIEFLLDSGPHPSTTEISLKEIDDCADRATKLIRQLLAFSRKHPLKKVAIDANALIKNLSGLLQRLVGEDIEITIDASDDDAFVMADPNMLEQVIMNLTANARDAMKNGGRLEITCNPKTIERGHSEKVAHAYEGDFVRLSISDTGPGIPDESLPYIFEPFYTTKDKDKGTGLGLATVYAIVRQHRGWIECRSIAEKGTSFDIYLPSCEKVESVNAAPPRPQKVDGGSETVLLVEDEDALRMLAIRILKKHDYDVIDASDAKSALEAFKTRKDDISILITDVIMPGGKNGIELAEEIRGSRPDVKVIYSSGFSEGHLDDETELDSSSVFLSKPYSPTQLAQTIRDLLDGKPPVPSND